MIDALGNGAWTMAKPPPLDRDPRERDPGISEWSCGHVAGSVCAECYRQLPAKAHALAEEVQRLRDAIDEHAAEIRAALEYRQP